MPPEIVFIEQSWPWFFPVVSLIFGATIGSFLNVCIYRIPAGKSVVFPGSHCACGKPIAWYDNIPVLSWFILRGRCRSCGQRFSFRYPAVEALTAVLFMLCWLRFDPAKALCGMFFCSILVATSFIDLDHMIIPDRFSIGAGAIGVLLSFAVPTLHDQDGPIFVLESIRSGWASMTGLLVGSAIVLWIAILAEAILKKEAMGFGDVKFIGAIGAFVGWEGAIFSIFGGAFLGSAAVAILMLVRLVLPRGKDDGDGSFLGRHIPFGPMMAAGALAYFLWLQPWVDAYFLSITEML